jgi:hypothetical protein
MATRHFSTVQRTALDGGHPSRTAGSWQALSLIGIITSRGYVFCSSKHAWQAALLQECKAKHNNGCSSNNSSNEKRQPTRV